MKKLIILVLALAAGQIVSAQQKSKTNYMSISIFEQAGRIDHVIVTRTDTAQETKEVKIKVREASVEKALTDEDAALMQLLTPYYNKGWKLVSFTVDNSILNGSDFSKTFRYYFSKDEL
jgi:hypothetical protein